MPVLIIVMMNHSVDNDDDHDYDYDDDDDDADLIFITNITEILSGEKICYVKKFQISIKNLNNLWSFIEIYAVFVLNLCGEKSVWRKSLWIKMTNMRSATSYSFSPYR